MAKKKQQKIIKITTNNQVAIPASICRDLGLDQGAYLQVEEKNHRIVMTPMRLVDSEDFSMYEKVIKKGREQFKKGETVAWEDVKKKLNRYLK